MKVGEAGFYAFASLEISDHDSCIVDRLQVLDGRGTALKFFFDSVVRYGVMLSKYDECSG